MSDQDELMGNIFGNKDTDMKDMVEELNSDTETLDGFSKIDTRTRLSGSQINAIAAIDTLVLMKVFPPVMKKFTKANKLLMISHKGKGRTEIVDILKAERQAKQGETLAQKVVS